MNYEVVLRRLQNSPRNGMPRLLMVALGLVLAPITAHGEDQRATESPFVMTWRNGRCLGCKIAAGLGRVQFVSRKDVWAVGPKGDLGGGTYIVIRSTDGGRTWRELPQTQQYAGGPGGEGRTTRLLVPGPQARLDRLAELHQRRNDDN
jgi:hypothetical protein